MNSKNKKGEVNYPSEALGRILNLSVYATIWQVMDVVASALRPYVQPGDVEWDVFYSRSGCRQDLPLIASEARTIMTEIREELKKISESCV